MKNVVFFCVARRIRKEGTWKKRYLSSHTKGVGKKQKIWTLARHEQYLQI